MPTAGLRGVVSRLAASSQTCSARGPSRVPATGTSQRKLARRRKRTIEEDQDPRHAAHGLCRRCAMTHRLVRTPVAEAEALSLVSRIRSEGRLDFDAEVPDPEFAVERLYETGGGKMLGVLLARRVGVDHTLSRRTTVETDVDAEEYVVIKAFSGQLFGEWRVAGWAPPLCWLTHDHPQYRSAHDKIRKITEAATEKRKAADILEEQVRRESSKWDEKIGALTAELRAARIGRQELRREAARKLALAGGKVEHDREIANFAELQERLANESRSGKRRIAQLRAVRQGAIADVSAQLKVAREQTRRLRDEHRAQSSRLLTQIFDSYYLPNFRPEGGFGSRAQEKRALATQRTSADTEREWLESNKGTSGATLRESFVPLESGGDRIGRAVESSGGKRSFSLPCGCGDCCAPKLLAECARRGLEPVSIAEIWMGVPTPGEGDRTEGSFYGACRTRCQPILGHMLCGADKIAASDLSASSF
jgi:hypothetical protein